MKLVVNLDDPSDIERAKAMLAPLGAGGPASTGRAAPSAPAPTSAPPMTPPAPPAAPLAPPSPNAPPSAAPTPPASAAPPAAAPPPPAATSPSSPPPPPPPAAASNEGVAALNAAMQKYATTYKAPGAKARWTEMATAFQHPEWKNAKDIPAEQINDVLPWFATA